jgi:ribonuclease P protein component
LLRLKNATDFERVRRDGRSHAHPLVVLIACPRPAPSHSSESTPPPSRIGFAAGKRVGAAVARNRAKRLLREAARARYPDLAPGWELVFIARAPLAKVKLPEAQQAVDNLLQRAHVLKIAD